MKAAAAMLVLAGCAASPRPRPAATDDARATVLRQYEAIRAMDFAAWRALLDDDVRILGTGPAEAWNGADAAEAGARAFYGPLVERGLEVALTSKALQVTTAADGRAAWMSDELDYALTLDGETTHYPLRITEILVAGDGGWRIAAEHVSVAVPNEDAFARALGDGWPAPAPITGGVAPGGDELASLVDATVGDPVAWLATFSNREDAEMIGTAPGERVLGGAAIREGFGAAVADLAIETRAIDPPRVVVHGDTGWAFANLEYRATIDGTTATQPYRMLAIYAREPSGWRIVQAHFSNAVPE